MNNYYYIILFYISLILTANSSDEKTKYVNHNLETFLSANAQSIEERKIVGELNSLKKINLSKTFEIYRPYLLEVNKENITLFDQLNFGFHQFDFNMNLVNKFGKKGRGPGEFFQPVDITVDKSGSYWILDGRSNRLSRWTSDGNLLEEVSTTLGLIPHRFRILESIQSKVLFSLMSEKSFHLLNEEGEINNSFLSVGGFEYNKKGFLLDGKIDTYPDDNIIYYVGALNGLMKAYSMDGELIYSRKIIVPPKLDFLKMDVDKIREAPFATHGFSVYKDKIIVLQNGAVDENYEKRFLDIYDKYNGDYLHSFILDIPSVRLATSSSSNPRWVFLGLDKENDEMILSIYDPPF